MNFQNIINENTKKINIESLNNSTTLLMTVDMINGFIREGALASNRIEKIIPEVVELNKKLNLAKRLFFVDEHKLGSLEFNSFPPHCLEGSYESEIIDELKGFTKDAIIIPKNSVNGFFAPEFIDYFESEINNITEIVICGCCTDICCLNIALNLRTALNQFNKNIDVKVVVNAVETYDAPNHEADTVNIISLYTMMTTGVTLVEI